MDSKEKIARDDSAGKVEERNGGQVCVFVTTTGKEVLFERNKQGYVVKTTHEKIETFDLAWARNRAVERLSNPYTSKDSKHTVRVVLPNKSSLAHRQLWWKEDDDKAAA
jgi:hypothetical protein